MHQKIAKVLFVGAFITRNKYFLTIGLLMHRQGAISFQAKPNKSVITR